LLRVDLGDLPALSTVDIETFHVKIFFVPLLSQPLSARGVGTDRLDLLVCTDPLPSTVDKVEFQTL
jgi:hypothetical protein